MPIVGMRDLLNVVQARKTIAPAFNTTNLETTLAIMDGIEQSKYPGIIQIAPTNVKLSGYSYISEIVKRSSNIYETPMSLHLDHGKGFEDIKMAVEAGFDSVMIDGAELDFEDNIKLTRRCVEYCRFFNIPVEAELGALAGKEDDQVNEEDIKTDPTLVKEFVKESGCDLLAVSIGNVHGLGSEPSIDFELLEKIKEESPVPLVLHGGSGIPNSLLREMPKYNVVKINIASDLRRTFIQTIGRFYEKNNNEHNLIKVLMAAKESVTSSVAAKTREIND
ncbi:class II aldolase [Niallia sp. HCP3S3_B10]|uniref:class II aldolase n=1 Tax=Niallia sp. HCP3S3_B10 TaxID=3438944 RepID=UPI003F8C2FB5